MKNFISNYYNLQYLYFWSSQLFINLLIWVITHHDFTMVISYNLALVLIYLLFWLKPSIIQNLKYLFLIVFMFSLVLNKNYILLTFYTLLLFYFYIVKNKNTQWSIKFIDDYKKDFDIIESHLNNEFILFRPLRDFNVFLSFLLLLTPRFSNLFIEESWLLDTITYLFGFGLCLCLQHTNFSFNIFSYRQQVQPKRQICDFTEWFLYSYWRCGFKLKFYGLSCHKHQ